ncbi:leucine-rich repeat receptor protein kinase EMS1 [Typha latifolia]|uniref:leucine-rich repeat receptor protein kinase EMS1 n=1 Tax=Typha latifolia TaxID=4733 RepID=UPI003C2D1A0E
MDPPLQALIAAVAAFLFISLLFGLLVVFCRHPPVPPRLHSLSSVTVAGAGAGAGEESTFFFDPSLSRVSLTELSAATKGFSPDAIIGDGSFGFVYKAVLPSSNDVVAVKRLSSDAAAFRGFREFRAEVETLGRIRHANLARLLAFSSSGPNDRLLIYEFLPQGSLDAWLHDPDHQIQLQILNPDPNPLPFPIRLVIAKGIARGIAFLHEECKPPIIHRDIKASNVLLEVDFNPKIADFGLARLVENSRSHVSTQVAGTMGYMAPEYKAGTTIATAKADVYSFGVLIVEVLTGRRPSWPVREEEEGKEVGLIAWARRKVEEGKGLEILDRRMEIQAGKMEEEVRGLLDVAYKCTDDSSRERPSMGKVVKLLDQI